MELGQHLRWWWEWWEKSFGSCWEERVAGAHLQTSDSEMSHLRGEPGRCGGALPTRWSYLVGDGKSQMAWSRRMMMKTEWWLRCVGDQQSEAHLCSSPATNSSSSLRSWARGSIWWTLCTIRKLPPRYILRWPEIKTSTLRVFNRKEFPPLFLRIYNY